MLVSTVVEAEPCSLQGLSNCHFTTKVQVVVDVDVLLQYIC
jgi:hypothetical protein